MVLFKLIVLCILIAITFAGCAAHPGTSPKGLEGPVEKVAIRFSADMKTAGYGVITTDELKKWLYEGRELTIISASPAAEEMKFGTIPGDVNAVMPLSENDIPPEDRVHLLEAAGNDKKRMLVVYSASMACRRSHVGAKTLLDYGYTNVYRYPAGIAGWREGVY